MFYSQNVACRSKMGHSSTGTLYTEFLLVLDEQTYCCSAFSGQAEGTEPTHRVPGTGRVG